jgi:hypothetical protein
MLDNETTGFYLDGSPSRMDFVAREKPGAIDWANFNLEIEWSDSAEVLILRASLFFHAEQTVTLGKLREFYTPKAIKLLEKDGYIKLIIDHGEQR